MFKLPAVNSDEIVSTYHCVMQTEQIHRIRDKMYYLLSIFFIKVFKVVEYFMRMEK